MWYCKCNIALWLWVSKDYFSSSLFCWYFNCLVEEKENENKLLGIWKCQGLQTKLQCKKWNWCKATKDLRPTMTKSSVLFQSPHLYHGKINFDIHLYQLAVDKIWIQIMLFKRKINWGLAWLIWKLQYSVTLHLPGFNYILLLWKFDRY